MTDRTKAEEKLGIEPIDTNYEPGDVRRYGAKADEDDTDKTRIDCRGVGEYRRGVRDQLWREYDYFASLWLRDPDRWKEPDHWAHLYGDLIGAKLRAATLVQRSQVRQSGEAMTLPTTYHERKDFPLMTFLTAYFPDAIEALVRLSKQGNVQHEIAEPKLQPFYLPGDRIAWDRSKSNEQMETLMRHAWDHMRAKRRKRNDQLFDTDGHLHAVKTAWRALAELQLTLESLYQPDGEDVTP